MAREVLLQRSAQPTQRLSMAHDRSARLPYIRCVDNHILFLRNYTRLGNF